MSCKQSFDHATILAGLDGGSTGNAYQEGCCELLFQCHANRGLTMRPYLQARSGLSMNTKVEVVHGSPP
eukprot:1144614-Pelagomonas_calceolata.AAC.5